MPAPRRATVAPVTSGGSVNFGDDSFYSGGLGLPEGLYAFEFYTQIFQPTKQNGQPAGAAFLAVMGVPYPINEDGTPSAEAHEPVPFGLGTKSHASFTPSADGKGLDAVPGGTGIGVNDMCNWAIFRESLKAAGMPPGFITNDFSVLDGIWVRTRNIPEPEERKNLRNSSKGKTGEAALNAAGAAAEPDRNRTVVTVLEVLAGGWLDGGGIPDATAPITAAAPAAGRRPVARAAAAPAPAAPARPTPGRRPAPVAAAPAVAADFTEEDVKNAAAEGLGAWIGKPANAKGGMLIGLKTNAFTHVQTAYGDDLAQAASEMFIQDAAALDALLGELGYRINGARFEVVG